MKIVKVGNGKPKKVDYSNVCTHNDDKDPHCLNCTYFIFPIGYMRGEDKNE